MQVIEAQRASILEPHDHLHISQVRIFAFVRILVVGFPALADPSHGQGIARLMLRPPPFQLGRQAGQMFPFLLVAANLSFMLPAGEGGLKAMTEDVPKPWLPPAMSECPVDRQEETWFKSSLYWFGRQFGTEVFYRDPILPSAGFLSNVNDSISAGQVEELITHLCGLMMVDPGLVKVELFDGSAEKKEAAQSGRKRTVGHFQLKDGQAIIALDQSEFSDPAVLTAIAVHELCHLRLQGEGRIRRGAPDGERLTDLLTVYFGFGIFTTNAAMSFARADRGWTVISRGLLDDRALNAARNEGYSRLGYLRSAEFGYALACYCWLRREETVPAWTRYVNPGPYVYLERGLAYLKRASRTGELPPLSALTTVTRQ